MHRVEIASEDGSSVKKQMEDYEKIEAQVDFMEEDTLDEASKVDICLEAADHAEELATLVSSFHSLKSFVNSEAIGSTLHNSFLKHANPSFDFLSRQILTNFSRGVCAIT